MERKFDMLQNLLKLYENKLRADLELQREINDIAYNFEKLNPEEFEKFIHIVCQTESLVINKTKEIYSKISELAKNDVKYLLRKVIFHKIHNRFL